MNMLIPRGIERRLSASNTRIGINISVFKHEYATFQDTFISVYDPTRSDKVPKFKSIMAAKA
ncbi:hypothetical protein KEJ17_01345, partial [Candidatus Bathyarchaeota archaeon]|nr:hypothetical protein [Candidatus Bathyarchaeota archaeon]